MVLWWLKLVLIHWIGPCIGFGHILCSDSAHRSFVGLSRFCSISFCEVSGIVNWGINWPSNLPLLLQLIPKGARLVSSSKQKNCSDLPLKRLLHPPSPWLWGSKTNPKSNYNLNGWSVHLSMRCGKAVGYIEFDHPKYVPMAIDLSGQLLVGERIEIKPLNADGNPSTAGERCHARTGKKQLFGQALASDDFC
ncbi:hypothetical protein RHGRI_018417 [Rhododendron griersonianum]|uniref:RRM domain-containing protein n=1 Tax=Rhododendron griersonianum TaxID=479676 RepID=A0AAV6K1J2_9ERIC|nr:hypothetical protein RHGRI_018417 [Rhododendron griersonianum]